MAKNNYQAPSDFGRWQNIALSIGVVASIIILVIALAYPDQREQALRSWLLGFIFWGGIGIGSIGILLLQYLTGGAWGVIIRRTAEACSRTIWVIGLLFLPILIGAGSMYEWTHPGDDPILLAKAPYLNFQFWAVRAVMFFILWGIITYLLNNWSAKQDRAQTYTEAAGFLGRAVAFSGPTLAFFILIVTFASVDWVMSLDPHWYSTIWGFLFVVGWALSCFSFSVVVLAFLSDRAPMNDVIGKRHFHDIGKLMLALVMVWAYFNFSQFLIIWSGNLPEETTWLLSRMDGGWGVLGILLIIFHFAFPFIILLSREIKRRPKWLATLAIYILFVRLVDMFFLISPSPRVGTHGESLGLLASFSWMDIAAPIAVGGIWLWAFLGEIQKRPLVPIMDPFLENAIKHGKGH